MKWYQGTSFFLSASKRHILPLIHHVHSSVWGRFESKSTRGRQLFTLKSNFLFGWGKKTPQNTKKKERKEWEIKLRTISAQETSQTWEWKILNESLMGSDEECYGGEKKNNKQQTTNKQEWASMEDWLVVKSSICCCESRRRITRATSYSVFLGTGYSPAEVMKTSSPQDIL